MSSNDRSAPYGWVPGRENYEPFRTLRQLALFNYNLKVTCRACGHFAILDAPGRWWAMQKRESDDRIYTFVRRLYCADCKRDWKVKQRHPLLEITKEQASEALWPSPSEEEWRRVVNRQRS